MRKAKANSGDMVSQKVSEPLIDNSVKDDYRSRIIRAVEGFQTRRRKGGLHVPKHGAEFTEIG